jgi:hypothetical protein
MLSRLLSCALLAVACVSPAIVNAEDVTLENDYLRLRIAAPRGEVVSLVDKKTGRELIAGQHWPVFQLSFTEPGDLSKKHTWGSGDAASARIETLQSGSVRTVRVEFSGIGPRKASAACTFSATSGDRYLRCRISVQVPAGLVLESVRFPVVQLKTPLGSSPTDAVVLGTTKGGIWHNPAAWKSSRTVSGNQPGNLTAQFGCYYDPTGGLATLSFDARGYRKSLMASRTRDGLSVNWLQACFEASQFVQAYDIAWTSFSGVAGQPTGWRDAADLYKQWAVGQPWCKHTFAQRKDLPEWLKQGPAMVRFGREWLSKPERIEGWLRRYWQPEFARPLAGSAQSGGTMPLIIAYWGWEKHGDWVTPDYFPVYPSDAQFAQFVRLGREMNGHAFLWPSGYHYTLTYDKRADGSFVWDDRARFQAEAAPHSVHGRDGRPMIGDRFWLRGGQTACMCGGDPWTIDWFNRTAVGCVERGADLVQVDQVVGGNFPVCYRADHGHPAGPGLWMSDAFDRQLRTMLAACRKINPQAVVCVEEPNEWFLDRVGIQDYRDWEVMRHGDAEPASVFNYLYHEYVPTFQSNPHSGDRLAMAYCLVNGQMPHLVPVAQLGPGPLLIDGGLEEYAPGSPSGWSKVEGYQGRVYGGRAVRDETVRHGGKASLRLDTADGQIVQVSQNVLPNPHFAAGRKYRLSAWIKTDDMAQSNAIGVAALAGGVRSRGSWRIPFPPAGDWAQRSTEFTFPEGAHTLRIMIHVNGRARLWVDDLRLEELLPDGRVVEVQRSSTPNDHRLARQWVELYHGRGRPWLALGRMLHPPRLDCESIEYDHRRFAAIQHNAFAAADGSPAVVLANPTDKRQHGTLTWQGQQLALDLEPDEVRLIAEPKGQ